MTRSSGAIRRVTFFMFGYVNIVLRTEIVFVYEKAQKSLVLKTYFLSGTTKTKEENVFFGDFDPL